MIAVLVIIPPEYKDIEQRILNDVDEGDLEEMDKLINDVGIATAVKVPPSAAPIQFR
jgi:hypothetical protein